LGQEPPGNPPSPQGQLDRKLCQVVGLNQNYTSSSNTLYHIQIEDRGPVMDRVLEAEVRRVNLIVYANYGEANARIIHGRDHDYPDVRTHEHNAFIKQKIAELSAEARSVVEEKEQRQIQRIKGLIREYYLTKNDAAKKEFEESNALYPFLFSRAWAELKQEKVRPSVPEPGPIEAPPAAPVAAAPATTTDLGAELGADLEAAVDVVYPLDAELRDRVIEIERLIIELGHDIQVLKRRGTADDILLQTCRKLVARAQESLSGKEASEFTVRRLEMTRNSLMTTWRQVKSRLRPPPPKK
jgi:hypothetical protein